MSDRPPSRYLIPKVNHLLSLVFLGGGLHANAALLLYEGFDSSHYSTTGGYPSSLPAGTTTDALVWDPNTNVADNNHVSQAPAVLGFSSAGWVHGASIASSVYGRMEANQRSYNGGGVDLVTTTGQLNIRRTGTGSGKKTFSRELSLAGGTTASLPTTLYISGLITRTATSFDIQFVFSNAINSGTDSRSFTLSAAVDGIVTITGSGSTGVVSADALWNTDMTPTFFVMKVENAVMGSSPTNGDRISLYLNPDLTSEAANTPVLVYGTENTNFFVTANNDWSLARMTLGADPAQNGSVIFDELRISDSWVDAYSATIPEPHSALALVLSGAAFAFARKRHA